MLDNYAARNAGIDRCSADIPKLKIGPKTRVLIKRASFLFYGYNSCQRLPAFLLALRTAYANGHPAPQWFRSILLQYIALHPAGSANFLLLRYVGDSATVDIIASEWHRGDVRMAFFNGVVLLAIYVTDIKYIQDDIRRSNIVALIDNESTCANIGVKTYIGVQI